MHETRRRADGERRKSMCPSCANTLANPVGVSFTAGIQTLTYRCPACESTWVASAPEKAFRRLGVPSACAVVDQTHNR
jgi:hypothetical protein